MRNHLWASVSLALVVVGCGASRSEPAPSTTPAASVPTASPSAATFTVAAGSPPAAGQCAHARAIVVALPDVPYGSDAQIAAYAAAHAAELDAEVAAQPEMYASSQALWHVRSIRVHAASDASDADAAAAEQRARGYLTRLQGGEDFATLARAEVADGAVSVYDLGWGAQDDTDPALSPALETHRRGVVPLVMRTSFGFVIVEVLGLLPVGSTPEQARLVAAIEAEREARSLAPATALWSRATTQARAGSVDFADALRADPAAHDATVTDSRFFGAGTETNDLWDMSDAPSDIPTRVSSIAVGSSLAPIVTTEPRALGDGAIATLIARGFERLADGACPIVIVRPPLAPNPAEAMLFAGPTIEAFQRVATLQAGYEACYDQFGSQGNPAFGEARYAVVFDGGAPHSMLVTDEMHNATLSHCVTELIDERVADLSTGFYAPANFPIRFDAP